MTCAASTTDRLAPLGSMSAAFARALQAVNEELAIVGMSLGEDVFFLDRDGAEERRCYLTCAGEAAPRGVRALVTFPAQECHAFTDGPEPKEIAATSGTDLSSVFDFILAVVEDLTAPRNRILSGT